MGALLAVVVIAVGLVAIARGHENVGSVPASSLSPEVASVLGIAIQPLPVGASLPVYDLDAAKKIATDKADLSDPIAVDHGVVDAGPGRGPRNAWVLLFNGGNGNAVPGGPAGAGPATVEYSGVVIDDQTGEVLIWISKGHR